MSKNIHLDRRLLAASIDACTLTAPPRRRRSRGQTIPVSLAFLAVAAFLWLLAVMPL